MRSCTVCTGGSLIPATTSTLSESFGTIFAPACRSATHSFSQLAEQLEPHLMIVVIRETSLRAALDFDHKFTSSLVQQATDRVRRERHPALPYTPRVLPSDSKRGDSPSMKCYRATGGSCYTRPPASLEGFHGCVARQVSEKSRSAPRKGSIRADRGSDAMRTKDKANSEPV